MCGAAPSGKKKKALCSDEYFNSLPVVNVCPAVCDRLHSLFSAEEEAAAAGAEREREQRDAPTTQVCFLPQQPVT